MTKDQKIEKIKQGQGTDLKELELIIFHKGITDHRINLTLHKLDEFMQGEIFDEFIENLNLQAQEEQLENLK